MVVVCGVDVAWGVAVGFKLWGLDLREVQTIVGGLAKPLRGWCALDLRVIQTSQLTIIHPLHCIAR